MSNKLVEREFPVLEMTLALRHHLMDVLRDEDLAYKLPGDNPSLGALLREMGEVERSYIDSFKNFALDFDYRHDDLSVEGSVAKLRDWLAAQEAELKVVLTALNDNEIDGKTIQRSDGFAPPVLVQFHIYREWLLISYAKVSVYLKALGRSVSQQWVTWIG
jgi:hypothetical protein